MFHMLERLIEMRWPVSAVLSDESVAEELFKILQPFDVATTLLCGEENSTISCTLPVLHGLLQHLGPQEEDSSGITTFKCMVKQEIEERWEAE